MNTAIKKPNLTDPKFLKSFDKFNSSLNNLSKSVANTDAEMKNFCSSTTFLKQGSEQ